MDLPTQGNLEYHDHICIRWKVGCDLNFVTCQSGTVLFRKSELTLRLVKPNLVPLLIMQMKSDPILEGVYEIEVYIVNKKSSKFHCKNRFTSVISQYYSEIWSVDTKLIHTNKNELVTNDFIDFVCIINFSAYRCLGKQLNVTQPTDSSLEKLSADVSKLYKSSELSDISLKCGDRIIPAHKFLLSVRSDVFAAMFKSDMVECQQGVIDIQDIEPDVLDHLLKYIYSGKMDKISADTAMQLYRAADKYNVPSLLIKCRMVIIEEMTSDNVCDVLFLADAHADELLKNQVLSYLQKDKEFILSDQWMAFSKVHPDLAVEVYDFYVRSVIHT